MMNKKMFAVIYCFVIGRMFAAQHVIVRDPLEAATVFHSAPQNINSIQTTVTSPLNQMQVRPINLLDEDTLYRLEQGLQIPEAHPINTLKKVSYRMHDHVIGDIIKKTYRNEYFGKQEEHAKKQNELLESKKLLHARFKKLAIIAIIGACIWQYQEKNNVSLLNSTLFCYLWHLFGKDFAVYVVMLGNIVMAIGVQALIPYILGTAGTWWETQKKSAELKRFDLKKGHWELESSELDAVPFINAEQLDAYAKTFSERLDKMSHSQHVVMNVSALTVQ